MTAVIIAGDVRSDAASRELLRTLAPEVDWVEVALDLDALYAAIRAAPRPVVGVLYGDEMMGNISLVTRETADQMRPSGLIAAVRPGCRDSIARVMHAGAQGCVLTDSPAEELITAIRAVAAGHLFLPPAFLCELLDTLLLLAFRQRTGGSRSELTDRELEVLGQLALGRPNQEIATRLFISPTTVHTHVLSILRKLNARNRTEAVAMVYRQGLLRGQRQAG